MGRSCQTAGKTIFCFSRPRRKVSFLVGGRSRHSPQVDSPIGGMEVKGAKRHLVAYAESRFIRGLRMNFRSSLLTSIVFLIAILNGCAGNLTKDGSESGIAPSSNSELGGQLSCDQMVAG